MQILTIKLILMPAASEVGPTLGKLGKLGGSGDWRQLSFDDASPSSIESCLPTAALPAGFASQFITEALKPREGM